MNETEKKPDLPGNHGQFGEDNATEEFKPPREPPLAGRAGGGGAEADQCG